jgi:hypothetical protein
MDNRKYVPLGLPAEVARRLESEAKRLGLSRSAVVTAALSAYLPGLRRAEKATSSAAQAIAQEKGPR